MRGDEGPAQAVAVIRAHLAELTAERPSVARAAALSPKGAKTLVQILEAAQRVFIRDGYAGLSLRKVADEAGVALGNVSYYFNSKRALIDMALREKFSDYIEIHFKQLQAKQDQPVEMVLEMLDFYVRSGREAHPFFFQLWSYAVSDNHARTVVRELYRPIGRVVYYLIRAARPDIADSRVREMTLQIISLEEGVKLLIGLGPEDDIALKSAEKHLRDLVRKIILA